MGITTKNGDGGMTGLMNTKNVPKADDRLHLLGSIDELNSHLGLVRAKLSQIQIREMLAGIQDTLVTVMAGIADPHNIKYKLNESEVWKLETEMDRMETEFTMPEGRVAPGGNPISAEVDIARAVARRCERYLSGVTIKYGSDRNTRKYLNRLSDYLFILARYADALLEEKLTEPADTVGEKAGVRVSDTTGEKARVRVSDTSRDRDVGEEEALGRDRPVDMTSEAVITEVLKRLGQPRRITLEAAKRLIDRVEAYAKAQGLNAVVAVCGPDGNPIAVHVMDGAFLVSFDVAVKKAYTSASVKMSTLELAELSRPGGTFQGLQNIEGDKMVFFGGGVPLMVGGGLIGALGVSGGTGEEDDRVAQYGLSVLKEVL